MAGTSTTVDLGDLRARRGADVRGQIFLVLLVASVILAFAMVGAVFYDVTLDAWDIISQRFWDFLRMPSSSDPTKAGVAQGIRGSLLIALIVVATFPIGIAGAIYLEEYADDTWSTRLIQVTVRNLAGVPSIVYGLLGLAVFVQSLRGLTGGSSVIAAGLTLAVLVLPVVVITSAEAVRAVPPSLREGAYGLGATQWEVIRTQVVPAALPGILTGTVLAVARALGEAAPLLVIGAAGFYTTGNLDFLEQTQGAFTALPMNIANFARLPAETWRGHAAAASVVLLVLVFIVNLVAIIARARISKKLGR
ncbi:MAG: phosphate transport system permease protein PstA [Acidimicrobiales bacterium]|nr:MAG: phosphate transport system permease protein PstA [Acidimicrobiales bacterium]